MMVIPKRGKGGKGESGERPDEDVPREKKVSPGRKKMVWHLGGRAEEKRSSSGKQTDYHTQSI